MYRDKTSGGIKRPADKTSVGQDIRRHNTVGQNIRGDKRPEGQNAQRNNVRLGHIFNLHSWKNLLKNSLQTNNFKQYEHFQCVCRRHCSFISFFYS